MPRRTSTQTIINESDDEIPQTQLRRSTRNSTQHDKGHLNYDLKYHPADDELRPAHARKIKKAHGILVSDPAVRESVESDSDSDADDDSTIFSDDGSGNYAGRGGDRKRRSTSSISRVSKRRKSNSFEGSGLRCSTKKDIEKITKRYLEAWEALVEDLPPADAFELHATQYANAWEELATQRPEPIDDDEESVGDIHHDLDRVNDPGEDILSQRHGFRPLSSSTPRVSLDTARSRPPQSKAQPTLNLGTPFDDAMFGLGSQPSRSSQGIQSSFQNHVLDQEEAEIEAAAAAPRVRTITPPTGGFTPTSNRTITPRRKINNIVVHEDNATQWLEKTRTQRTSDTSHEDPKENSANGSEDDHDNPPASRAKTVPRRTVTASTESTIPRTASEVEEDKDEQDEERSSDSGSDSGSEDEDDEDEPGVRVNR